jgi:hypothetical protein
MARPRKYFAGDWIGKEIGTRKILSSLGVNNLGQEIVGWQCTNCKSFGSGRLDRYIDEPRMYCGKCQAQSRKTGTDHFSGSYFASLRTSASKRGYPFEITPDDCEKQYQKQKGLCHFTGLSLGNNRSVDRLDNTQGYTPQNIAIVRKEINAMKSDLPVEIFIELCRKVSTHSVAI